MNRAQQILIHKEMINGEQQLLPLKNNITTDERITERF